jgi:hypothetical protein
MVQVVIVDLFWLARLAFEQFSRATKALALARFPARDRQVTRGMLRFRSVDLG